MRSYASLLLLLLSMQSAEAATRLHYVAYSTGFRVLDVAADLDLTDEAYRIDLTVRTVGVFGAMVSGLTTTEVDGGWNGLAAAPHRYDSHGMWHGETIHVAMDYDGGAPHIAALLPDPDPDNREPVSAAASAGTVDTLSAMAALLRRVARTGGCDAKARLFDGRRLSDIEAHAVGMETLASTSRSMFHGPALRCDFEGRLLGGFKRDEDRARAAKPHGGSAWFAALTPGGPPLPVRITFETRFFGDATMYLAPPS